MNREDLQNSTYPSDVWAKSSKESVVKEKNQGGLTSNNREAYRLQSKFYREPKLVPKPTSGPVLTFPVSSWYRHLRPYNKYNTAKNRWFRE